MGFIEEFKRAYAGDDTQHYEVVGKQVHAPTAGERTSIPAVPFSTRPA